MRRRSDAEVYIRYFPSDRTFARRTERRREKTGTRAAATVGKRRRWLRYQLLGMRNGEAIEFPETKGAAGRDAAAGICFTIELELP